MRINVLVILAVVFVAGGRNEDRIEVQDPDAEFLQIIQLINDALDIAAVEAAEIGIGGKRIPGGGMLGMADGVVVLIVHDVVGGIAVAEPVGKDLILYGPFGPCGHMEAGNEAEGIDRIEIRAVIIHNPGPHLVIGNGDALDGFDQETVDDFLMIADNGGFIIIKKLIRARFGHQRADSQRVEEDDDAGSTVLRDPEADGDVIAGIRFGRETEERSFIGVYSGKYKRINGHGVHSFHRYILP